MMPLVLVALAVTLFFFVPMLFQLLWNITVPEIFWIEINHVLASFPSASYGRNGFRRRWVPSLQLQ